MGLVSGIVSGLVQGVLRGIRDWFGAIRARKDREARTLDELRKRDIETHQENLDEAKKMSNKDLADRYPGYRSTEL